MNRRSFIKRSAILLGLFVTEPRQFLNCISYLHKSPLGWRDKILQLYPDPSHSPLMEMLKHSKPVNFPEHLEWYNDELHKVTGIPKEYMR